MSVPSGPAVDNPRRSDLRTCPLLRASEALLATRATSHEHKRPTVYTEAMEVFHRAADLIGLNRRVRLELEEPDYEHIFYLSVDLRDRLVPVPVAEQTRFGELPETQFTRTPPEALPDGTLVLPDGGLSQGDVSVRDSFIRVAGKGVYRIEPGGARRFKAYRVQYNQARGPYKGGIRYHREVSL